MKATRRMSLALAIGLLVPAAAEGQALCSAPHSAPSLRPSGSIETIEPLTGWFQLAYFRQRSEEFYDPLGDLRPLLGAGRITTNSWFLTGAFGITEGFEIWGQLPVHDLKSSSSGGSSGRTGVGDVRFAARIGSELFGLPNVPFMVRGAAKVPGSDFPVDATIVPLSEGQVDWEFGVETGYYFAGAFPVQVIGTLGYRWRNENDATGRKPGNETFTYVGVGHPRDGWRLGLAFEGLWGRPPVDNGIRLPSSHRKLLQIDPTVAFQFGRTEVEIAGRFPVAGRNLAVGNSLTFSFFLPWALP